METTIEILKFDDMCRMCLDKSDCFVSIASNEIIIMIMACSSVQVSENDELPQQICESCYQKLKNAYQLKKVTENSDIILREAFGGFHPFNEKRNKIFIKSDEEHLHSPKIEEQLLLHSPKIEEISIDEETEENIQQIFDENTLLRLKQITDVEHKYAKIEDEDMKNDENDKEKINNNSSNENLLEINKILLENLNLVDEKPKNEIFTCEKCNKTFKKATELGSHMKRQHKADPIQCEKCSMVCYHELHLKSHMKVHTRGNFTCDICHKKLLNSHKLARHKISHSTERPFPCLQCSSTFKDKWVLFKHIKNVHMNMEKHAECPICRKSFVAYRLKDHLVIHEKERKTFKCDICAKILYSKVSLVKHKQLYHMNIVRESKHLCNICGRSTTNAALLKAHLLTHTGEKPFECDQCENKYRTKFALKKHISRVHLMERNHVCAICSDAFADKKTLMNHVRHHTGLERPFKCEYCDKAFGYKTGLKYHIKKIHALG